MHSRDFRAENAEQSKECRAKNAEQRMQSRAEQRMQRRECTLTHETVLTKASFPLIYLQRLIHEVRRESLAAQF